ncbi:MAG: nuclear transport factor 2 family protein [Actinomycetota bacterium]
MPQRNATNAVLLHCQYWNSRQRADWMSLFAPDVVFEDPVGARPKTGEEAIRNTWDRSLTPGREWTLNPTRIVGTDAEVAVQMHNVGNIDGRQVEVHGIEVWKVNPSGLVVSVRAFFEQPKDFELSPYFQIDRVD